jgi:hypothetical protein
MSRGTFPSSCLPVFYLPELLRKRVRHLGDATLRYINHSVSLGAFRCITGALCVVLKSKQHMEPVTNERDARRRRARSSATTQGGRNVRGI